MRFYLCMTVFTIDMVAYMYTGEAYFLMLAAGMAACAVLTLQMEKK